MKEKLTTRELIGAGAFGAIVGCVVGGRLLKKHFLRVGVAA